MSKVPVCKYNQDKSDTANSSFSLLNELFNSPLIPSNCSRIAFCFPDLFYFICFCREALPIIERNSGNFRIQQIPPAAPAAQPDPGSPPGSFPLSPPTLPLIQDFFFPRSNPWRNPDYPALGMELDFGRGCGDPAGGGVSHKPPFPIPKDGGDPIQHPGMVRAPLSRSELSPQADSLRVTSLNCSSLETPQPP